MAIYDTDKNSDTRNSPTPNISDAHTQRISDGTVGITNKSDASTGAYTSTKNGTVIVNDGTTNRIALGLLSDGTYGVRVMKEGVDLANASYYNKLFDSTASTIKPMLSGVVSVAYTASSGSASTQIVIPVLPYVGTQSPSNGGATLPSYVTLPTFDCYYFTTTVGAKGTYLSSLNKLPYTTFTTAGVVSLGLNVTTAEDSNLSFYTATFNVNIPTVSTLYAIGTTYSFVYFMTNQTP